jgi:hypothetical protein
MPLEASTPLCKDGCCRAGYTAAQHAQERVTSWAEVTECDYVAVAREHDAVQEVLAVMVGTRNPRVGRAIAAPARAAAAATSAAAARRTAIEHALGVDDESDARG